MVDNNIRITQITDNNIHDIFPSISGNNIAWIQEQDNGLNGEIYLYNGNSAIQITDNEVYDFSPSVSGNNIVWVQNGSDDDEIYFYDGTSITQLTSDEIDEISDSPLSRPSISGDKVVWRGPANEIFLYDGNSTTQLELNGNKLFGIEPSISGNKVVFVQTDDHDDEIYLYDGDSITQLTDNEVDDFRPLISGNNVVWLQSERFAVSPGPPNIFLYDGDSVTQLTNNGVSGNGLSISGNNIVWTVYDGNDEEVYFYDGDSITQLTDNEVFDSNPSISGYSVAWSSGWSLEDSSNYSDEIFVAQVFYDDPLFRFQNTEKPGTYLFADTVESESIRANYPQFVEEGFAFDIPSETEDDLVRFNRFRNKDSGGYLFASEEESISVRTNYPSIFEEEGIAFYTYGADAGKGVDIFRFRNTELSGSYIFVGEAERQNILANIPQYVEEGAAFEAIV